MKDLTVDEMRLLRKVATGSQPTGNEPELQRLLEEGMVLQQKLQLGGRYVVTVHGDNQLPKRWTVV